MLRLILSVFFSLILLSGCKSNAELMKKSFDQHYKVLDRGKLNVIVKSQACALIAKKAISGAKKNADKIMHKLNTTASKYTNQAALQA